ncbi:prepilin-type N-terminal cleavage/methylation domain-containing protein [Thiomicrorhabdus sp. 6S3-12]|uniref:prepilin-type N-terminal cleavage/methylation domain-containing protein n=1 Tax=Thiomicrorhabdus sp. 6S3-12 TaxID=2819681 RepID=UPI001AAD8B9E|nr:prepilin-type N-terminal cleavage/methylation domain-containing protein [Thiomicrorhabdus sp. 6S3-12]MBO1923854.1 prepilin-type N-terminal cleavage/methylation domain-containing protein [Thiomicrorhabdus sp. 6S3-12]
MDVKNMKAQRHAQKGFTLVEIAIVLVIIGLLLGGVLKGQEMINAAKIKTDTDSMKSLQASIYAYRDRAGFYPGTERATAPTNPALNGIEIGNILTTATTGYTAASVSTSGTENVFADLNNEGFLKSPNISPEVDDGGAFTVGYAEDGSAAAAITNHYATYPTVEANKNYVCISYTTSTDNAEAIAVGMDVKFDDGVDTTGIVRYASDPAGGANICLEI